MDVCEICGSKGYSKLLINCEECGIIVHRYCVTDCSMMKRKVVNWQCDDCDNNKLVNPASPPLRRTSKRLEARRKWKSELRARRPFLGKMLNTECRTYTEDSCLTEMQVSSSEGGGSFTLEKKKVLVDLGVNIRTLRDFSSQEGDEHEQLDGDHLSYNSENKKFFMDHPTNSTQENDLFERVFQHIILSSECDKGSVSTTPTSEDSVHKNFETELDDFSSTIGMYVPSLPTQPIINVAWRGNIYINFCGTSIHVGLLAHLSNKATLKEHGLIYALPNNLDGNIVPRNSVQPETFRLSAYPSDDIMLYVFPATERDENSYEGLLRELMDHDLAIITTINNIELLLFSSNELPQDQRRFQRRYYMWGLFKSKYNSHKVQDTYNEQYKQ